MVDVTNLSAVQAGLYSPAAALQVAPASDAMQVLSEISQSGGLSVEEITTLSAAVAQVDAGVQTASVRENLFSQVKGLGMYFRNSDTNGFPRWPLMTALRAYGLNLSGQSTQTEAAVAAQVQQNLNAIAQQSRGTSLSIALASATAAKVVGPAIEQAGTAVVRPVTSRTSTVTAVPAPEAPKAIDTLV
ncbi:MAG TPA: hypothetical protein VHP58_05595 [Alphaproteobacteria bacterium]|nr:hypothetical protein [Alphaproteobacteria bacterium]